MVTIDRVLHVGGKLVHDVVDVQAGAGRGVIDATRSTVPDWTHLLKREGLAFHSSTSVTGTGTGSVDAAVTALQDLADRQGITAISVKGDTIWGLRRVGDDSRVFHGLADGPRIAGLSHAVDSVLSHLDDARLGIR